ncbi:hypothetical protein [Haloferula sp.]|uniref:hypothetical protein n=1 Tax=Haloferula sp. TaxID=2497595 RepID=UPI003C761B0B
MQLPYLLSSTIPPLVLLTVLLKYHQRRKLPKTLLLGSVLMPLLHIPQAIHMVVGTQQVQDWLFQIFPEANNPYSSAGTTILIDQVRVGELYSRLFSLSFSLHSVALFFFGMGIFFFAKKEILRHHEKTLHQTPS